MGSNLAQHKSTPQKSTPTYGTISIVKWGTYGTISIVTWTAKDG